MYAAGWVEKAVGISSTEINPNKSFNLTAQAACPEYDSQERKTLSKKKRNRYGMRESSKTIHSGTEEVAKAAAGNPYN